MHPSLRAIYRIEAGPGGPARARQIVERELSSALPEPTLAEVKLMVSELVTNGIRHGCTRSLDAITFEMVLNGKLRCAVRDPGPGLLATQEEGDRGWGLKLIDQLASRWGFTRSAGATQVWFEAAFDRPSQDQLTSAVA